MYGLLWVIHPTCDQQDCYLSKPYVVLQYFVSVGDMVLIQ